MEKIEIAVIAAAQDDRYRQQVLTALEGALQFLEKRELIGIWHRGLIRPGSITAQEMWEHIRAARIILLLMSPDLLASNFYSDTNNHMDMIIQQSKLDTVRVIPVLIRSSSWMHSPFNVLTPLPANGIPLNMSSNKDKTLQNIAESVLTFVEEMLEASPMETSPQPATEIIQEKLSMSSSTFMHGHALLVGVGGDLAVTVDDAQNLGKVLEHSARAAYPSAQIETLLGGNATRTNILAAFDRLIERTKHDPDATVIVYFSGHGGKFSQDGQATEYFLIPHGYNPAQHQDTAISDHEFTTRIEAIQARKLVVLLDCCHAGAIPMLKDGGRRFTKSPLPPELLQALGSGSGRVVVASSHEGEKSQTNAQGSIFTNCLLEALRGKGRTDGDNAVRILSVLSYLLKEVPRRTDNQQKPFINKILNMNEDFVLCYAQVQKKDEPENTGVPAPSISSISLTAYQRGRLGKKRDELESSLKRYDEKIALLNGAVDIETDVLRRFQYQQQLFQELDKRTSIEEELRVVIQRLQL
jgi:uncharacterized caspase-like protein